MSACPRCDFEIDGELPDCPACGVIFERYEAAQRAAFERAEQAARDPLDPVNLAEAVTLLDVPRPLRWLARLHAIGGWISVLLAVLMLVIAFGEPAAAGAALLNGAVGALQIWIARGIRRRHPPVRHVLLFSAFVGLLAIPIGTILSVLLLFYLFHPGMKILFSDVEPTELTEEQLDHLDAFRDAPSGAWFVRTTVGVMVLVLLVFIGAIGLGGKRLFDHGLNVVTAESDLRAIDFEVRDFAMRARLYPRSQHAPQLARVMAVDIPILDPWGNPYAYERYATKAFRVGSAGPDGEWTLRRLRDYAVGVECGDDIVIERGKVFE